ncbi:metal-dependent hydrolase [Halorussus marinus]|uniref:metal-dependent hydrolase n=1 Tax=Halorussus marinus TaxID=2505976 RepID=UPI0010932AF8|nr:metal-dependent hydrolase [Halorussus marinus]
MVDVLGHLGMALIWLAPAWLVIDARKTAATFVGVGFWFGMLPDVDLVLANTIGTVKHHGIFHTVLAVGIMAAVVGPIVGYVLKKVLGGSTWFSDAAADDALSLGVVMVFVAGVAHVFADILSAPDISEGIEPFWPVYAQTLGIDLVWYNNPWVNWGLFLGGVALNVALYVRATPEPPRRTRA